MRKASKKTVAEAVDYAKTHKTHVVVGWHQFASLLGPAQCYETKKWPSKRAQDKQFRDIHCIVKPDGTIFTF